MYLVHIGLQRSGSTWLQERYIPSHPDMMMLPYWFTYELSASYQPEFDKETWQVKLHQFVEENDVESKILCLSQENLCGHILTADGRDETAQRIAETVGSAKILLVLRHPLTYMISMYTFGAKWGVPHPSLHKFLRDPEVIEGFSRKFDYLSLISAYRQHFDDQHICVLPYELLRDDLYAYSQRICNFLNIPVIELSSQEKKAVNRSSSILTTRLYTLANRLDGRSHEDTIRANGRIRRWMNHIIKSRIYRLLEQNLPYYNLLTLNELPDVYRDFLVDEKFQIWSGELASYNYTFH